VLDFDHGVPQRIETFPGGNDAQVMCFLKLGEFKDLRESLRRWTPERSDIDGCCSLTAPVLATPAIGPSGLMSSSVPFLLVIEEVYRKGWREQDEANPCAPIAAPFVSRFSSAKLNTRVRAYFCCLLKLTTLFELGLTQFLHSLPAGYYHRLLVSPTPELVERHLSAKDHDAFVAAMDTVNVPPPVRENDEDYVESEAGSSVCDQELGTVRKRTRDTPAKPSSMVGSDAGVDSEPDSSAPKSDSSSYKTVGSSGNTTSDSGIVDDSDHDSHVVSDVPTNMPELVLPLHFEGHEFKTDVSFTHPG